MVKMPKCKASEPILFDLVHYIHQQEGFGGCKHTMLLMIATNHDMTAVLIRVSGSTMPFSNSSAGAPPGPTSPTTESNHSLRFLDPLCSLARGSRAAFSSYGASRKERLMDTVEEKQSIFLKYSSVQDTSSRVPLYPRSRTARRRSSSARLSPSSVSLARLRDLWDVHLS